MPRRFSRREFLGGLAATTLVGRLARAQGEPPAAAPQAKFFRAANMVGRVTSASAVIQLVTSKSLAAPVSARLLLSDDPARLSAAPVVSSAVTVARASSPLELPVTGLSPGRRYHYRVQVSPAAGSPQWQTLGEDGEFHTQRKPGDAFEFCIIADPHWGHEEFRYQARTAWGYNGDACLRQMSSDGPFDFCIDLGDSAYPEYAESAEDAFISYESYRQVMAPILRSMPVFVVLGNHEREAGFFQRGDEAGRNGLGPSQYHQKWATEARLTFIPNPRGDTYPEGGEGNPRYDSRADWGAGSDPWNDGTSTHLQNFYAFTWGDALFVVLDPFRYSLVGQRVLPSDPSQYKLGRTQRQFLEDTLAASKARWKFVVAHHQFGGGLIDIGGGRIESGRGVAYGRGSAIEAIREGTDQAVVHDLMRRHGAQFFVYGHDHAFCHSIQKPVDYLLCGRPTWINPWYAHRGLLESYGSAVIQGRNKPWIKALYTVLGYTRFRVSPEKVTMEWVRTGFSFRQAGPDGFDPDRFQRDGLESWYGNPYPVEAGGIVRVAHPPLDVDGARTVSGATVMRMHQAPSGKDYYLQPSPRRPENHRSTAIPLRDFPVESEKLAVVDCVPETIYRYEWSYPTAAAPARP